MNSAQVNTPMRLVSLRFTGNATEYFRIWIVNVTLSVLTLGIYSAWAKVRNKRYFYGNTQLDGAAFEYHGLPLQILKGRIIAVLALLLFVIISALNPLLAVALSLLLALLTPLAVRQGLRFNMAMSSYRGIRFSFRGAVWPAVVAYLLAPLLASLTAYLMLPWAHKKASEYRLKNTWFGVSPYYPRLSSKKFYAAYASGIVIALFLAVLLVGAVTLLLNLFDPALLQGLANGGSAGPLQFLDSALGALGLVALFLLGLLFRAYVNARTTNHLYAATTLDSRLHFKSSLQPLRLMWIYLSNLLAILLTLGLATPWAKVRLLRYRIESLQVFASASLDDFVAAADAQQTALGDELVDAFDVNVGGI